MDWIWLVLIYNRSQIVMNESNVGMQPAWWYLLSLRVKALMGFLLKDAATDH